MGITVTLTNLEAINPRDITKTAKFLMDFAMDGVEQPAGLTQEKISAIKEEVAKDGVSFEVGQFDGGVAIHTEPAQSIVPPPPPAKTESGIEVDSDGLPWDGRIHAASRKKNAYGTWRNRRGIEDEFKHAVERELQITMGIPVTGLGAPQPVAATVPPPPAEVPPPPPFVASAEVFAAPPAITPDALAGAAPTVSHSNPTFPQLMMGITKGFADKSITQSDIQSAIAKVGLPSLPMLASRPDLVGDVATALGLTL